MARAGPDAPVQIRREAQRQPINAAWRHELAASCMVGSELPLTRTPKLPRTHLESRCTRADQASVPQLEGTYTNLQRESTARHACRKRDWIHVCGRQSPRHVRISQRQYYRPPCPALHRGLTARTPLRMTAHRPLVCNLVSDRYSREPKRHSGVAFAASLGPPGLSVFRGPRSTSFVLYFWNVASLLGPYFFLRRQVPDFQVAQPYHILTPRASPPTTARGDQSLAANFTYVTDRNIADWCNTMTATGGSPPAFLPQMQATPIATNTNSVARNSVLRMLHNAPPPRGWPGRNG